VRIPPSCLSLMGVYFDARARRRAGSALRSRAPMGPRLCVRLRAAGAGWRSPKRGQTALEWPDIDDRASLVPVDGEFDVSLVTWAPCLSSRQAKVSVLVGLSAMYWNRRVFDRVVSSSPHRLPSPFASVGTEAVIVPSVPDQRVTLTVW